MSREIKFRGNSLVTKEEVFGHLFYFDDGRYFISPKGTVVEGDEGEYPSEYYLRGMKCIEVEPETVSQCTGLKDKNGTEVYVNDIVEDEYGRRYEIVFEGDCLRCNGVRKKKGGHKPKNRWFGKGLKVIGNRYENPELLKER